MSLNGLEQPPELPLMGPLSGAKPPPRWQPPETGFDPQHMQCLRFTCAREGETGIESHRACTADQITTAVINNNCPSPLMTAASTSEGCRSFA